MEKFLYLEHYMEKAIAVVNIMSLAQESFLTVVVPKSSNNTQQSCLTLTSMLFLPQHACLSSEI